MSNSWNGLSLQTEFSTMLGDVSTSFKAKALQWMNDVQLDIISRHDWKFNVFKGKKNLAASTEIHSLDLTVPTLPTATVTVGGSLTDGSTYSALITYVESVSGVESLAGAASATVTGTAANKTVSLTAIPVSSDPLVTSKKIYLSKDGASYYYHGSIVAATLIYTIGTETTSTVEAPSISAIRKLDGAPFLEGSKSGQLVGESLDQLRMMFSGTWSSGTPEYFADLGGNRILVYPTPSAAMDISFYYYKNPKEILATATSFPEIPAQFKLLLKAGVMAQGWEYRERDGWQSKKSEYENMLGEYYRKLGKSSNSRERIRDVTGGCDGFLL